MTATDIVETNVILRNTLTGAANPEPLTLGEATDVVFVASDRSRNTSRKVVSVFPKVGPALTVPGNIVVVGAEGVGVASDTSVIQAFLEAASAYDDDGNELDVTNDAGASFPVGATIVTFSVTDAIGRTTTATATVTVIQATSFADTDGDGMSDLFEVENQLDPNRDDALEDLDGDGLDNLSEYRLGKDPTRDDVEPVLALPSDVRNAATGWYTPVDVGVATATDALDGELTATRDPQNDEFRPGVHTITWSATDAAGNLAQATQSIEILPLAQVSSKGRIAEGQTYAWTVSLSGNAPSYPVDIPFALSGTASSESDYSVSAMAGKPILIAKDSTWRYLDDGIRPRHGVARVKL